MFKFILVIGLLTSFSANACEKHHFKYRPSVPVKYAEGALIEYGAESVTLNTKPVILAGSNCSGAKIITALYASEQGTYYVSLVFNSYNQLEVKSRGVTTQSIKEISDSFTKEPFVLPNMPLE